MKRVDWLGFVLILSGFALIVALTLPHADWFAERQDWTQAVSSAGILILTAVLAVATWRYANLTNTLVNLTQKQLEALTRPELSLDLFLTPPHGADLKLINLGPVPVVVISICLRELGKTKRNDFDLHQPLHAHKDATVNVAPQITEFLAPHVDPATRRVTADILVGVDYQARGISWGFVGYMLYRVTMSNGYLEQLAALEKRPMFYE